LRDPRHDAPSIHREVFEHSTDALFVVAVDEAGAFDLIDANPAWERLTGSSLARLQAPAREPAPAAADPERLRECLRRKSRIEYRAALPAPDGPQTCHVTLTPMADGAGRIHRILGTLRNTGEQPRRPAQLPESERCYRDIFDNVSDAVCLLGVTDDGHFRSLAVNPAFERALGMPAAALIGRRIDETVPADRADVVVAKCRRCVATGAMIEEEIALDLQTGPRVFHSMLIPVLDGSGRVHRIIGASRDITERKRAEQEFRTLVEHSPDTVVRYDRDCRRSYVNPAFVSAAGLPEADLLGLRPGPPLVVDPDAARRFEDCLRAVLASGQEAVFDLAWRGLRGGELTSQIRLVAERDAGGAVAGVLAIGRDITALMETQRQLRALIDGLPDFIFRYDREGRVVYVSAPSLRRMGGRPQDYLGKTLAELDARYGPAFGDSVRGVVRSGLPQSLELPFPLQGELRHWDVRHVPELDDQGRVTGVLGVGRDITERHRADQTIRELHRRREAAREEERRHIARELHDEMGQYLSALHMSVSMLRLGPGGADPALRENALGLQGLVEQVIQVMRNVVSDLRPSVLDHGVASALEWLAEEFRGRSGVTCHLRIDDVSATLDAQQTVMVFRIVQESLANVARHAGASRVDVTFERHGGDCVLTVRDDGRGFDAAQRPHRALGLVGLKERAQMLGGQLDIRSRPGAGTVISVAFPTVAADPRP